MVRYLIMETLFKMLNVFSWILVIGCPILIIVKIWLQSKYENSLEKTIDSLKGVEAEYTGGLVKLAVLFVVALVYLLVR